MGDKEVKDEFAKYISTRVDADTFVVINELVKIGIMNKNKMLIVLCKRDYEEILQNTGGEFKRARAVLDIAVKYDTTVSFVNKCIYARQEVRL